MRMTYAHPIRVHAASPQSTSSCQARVSSVQAAGTLGGQRDVVSRMRTPTIIVTCQGWLNYLSDIRTYIVKDDSNVISERVYNDDE